MRLINTTTLKLEYVVDGRSAKECGKEYAILSHTWCQDEVLFADMNRDEVHESVKRKKGWKKIVFTCAQARKDEINYAWIDTCCTSVALSIALCVCSLSAQVLTRAVRPSCQRLLTQCSRGMSSPRSATSILVICRSMHFGAIVFLYSSESPR